LDTLGKPFLQANSPDLILTDQLDIPSIEKAGRGSLYNDLLDEAGQDVVYYLECYNLIQSGNFILLSSKRHYLYGPDELKQLKTLINLKLINQGEQITFCLKTMNRVLPTKGFFVGRFLDYKCYERHILQTYPSVLGHVLLFIGWLDNKVIPLLPLISWLHYKVNPKKIKFLTTLKMRKLLEKNGFMLVDVREIRELTYFISQKVNDIKIKTIFN